jgi:hypothetical protein
MAKNKTITKEQLEDFICALEDYQKGELQSYINNLKNQLGVVPFATTPPGPPPKNPPGIP